MNHFLQSKISLRGLTIIVIIFLIFYSFYVFSLVQNRPESAYSNLIKNKKESKLKLQDTRAHGWSEIK